MRVVLTLIAGGAGRVSISAAAIVACAFVLPGHGWDLARAAWHAGLFAAGFLLIGVILCLIGQAAGVADGEAAAPAPKEADHG